ncbi:NADH-quinone oxidoreductase subunit NuoE [Calderihabitans maritimus]|uniref:NADH-quinone oxidoreductase subunit E n=1 Tax=Calderihabitans maritimus TaxID=1246530 RepID=A0A1Z5HXU9_9FIRM|nr:NADH-quinone oxidoreductase subunit NuoE [Calderihabitans maritimus]GAW94197.1 NADH-quinone oxidoreductase subunit E [Calderihabitans maritimus]
MSVKCCNQQKKKPKDPDIEKLIQKYRETDGGLIPLLQETQDIKGYLPREVLEQIAEGMKISLAKVCGVATFYAQFSLKPKGRNTIRVCTGTACHVRGGRDILETIGKQLKIPDGGTTEDRRFTLETVACVGACSLAPVVVINHDTHGQVTPEQIPCILDQYT